MKNPFRLRTRHALALTSLAFTHIAFGQAITNQFTWINLDDGNWNEPTNWANNNVETLVPPLALTDEVTINNGATVTLDQTLIEVARINVAGAGGSGLIVTGDNGYYTRQLRVGYGQVGTLEINAGDVNLLNQGEDPASLPPQVLIGQEGGGNATVNQTGGSLNADASTATGGHEDFRIGAFGAVGVYNLSGGTLTMWNLRCGFASQTGSGVINHSGGTLNHYGDLALGWACPNGTYNLSGDGVLNVIKNDTNGRRVRIGATANQIGHFNQSGGTAVVTARFELGTEGAAQGFYDISGGSMTVNEDIMVGAFNAGTTGTLTQTGGSLTANRVRVGVENLTVGHVYLNGGTLTTSAMFKENAGSTATLSFNGGTIKATGGGNFIYGFSQIDVLAGGMIIDTNNQGDTIVPPLVGPGGLTKKGAGFAALGVLSNYDGNTVVEQGTLRLTAAGGLNPTSTVTIPSTGANLDLTYVGSDTVAGLIVDGNPMPAGTYGALPGGGGVTGVSYITGTGTLIVQPPAASGYTAWSEDPANNLAPGERGATMDPDFDGLNNLTEYFLGGAPKVSSTAPLPTITRVGTDIQFAFNRSVASGTDTTAVIQWSTDLSTWPPANEVPVSGTGAINQTIPGTNAVGGKLFTRLKITRP